MIGTQFAHYEITGHLGSGGMGEVYQATDSKLGRSVAIKLLPEAFACDEDRAARFEREARVLASLNHPNIAVLHGLEESGGRKFLVMELVDGETLAERIKRGPIPVDEALGIAKQIAEGLEAAHEKGIIHRDLKPANVKITPDGKVKVLDFGLAKVYEVETSNANLSNSPTLSIAMTNAGMIMGTATYMAPEQARGRNVDRRADVWAFGCVLYEMLTGKRVFEGEEVTDTLAQVLTKEPDWSILPDRMPSSVHRVLRRCLQKDLRWRIRDIGDARIDIEESGNEPEGLSPVDAARHGQVPKLWLVFSAVLLLATIVLGARLMSTSRTPGDSAVVRFFVSAPDKTTFDVGGPVTPVAAAAGSISPNGRKLAFTVRGESRKVTLWVRALDTLTAQPLPGTEDAAMPFWSPDGQSIAFFAQGKLKKIDVEGGQPQTLCEVAQPRGGSWSRDGVILFGTLSVGPLYRVSSSGGQAAALTKLTQQQTAHRFPSFLPDGKHFFYFATGAPEASGVFIGSLDSLDGQRLLTADSSAIYARSGHILFVRQGTLLAQPFDDSTLKLSGEPVRVAEQIAFDGAATGFSVSESGVLAYRTGAGNQNSQLTWVDRNGKLIETIGSPAGYLGPDLSPDGKRIAIHLHEGSGGDVWIVETPGGKTSRLTFDASQENSHPVWSPDGSHIAFGSKRNGKWGIYLKPSNGTGNEELLVESESVKLPMSWSTDGKFIVYWVDDPKTRSDVWAVRTADRKSLSILQTPFSEQHPQISPDAKWIAYESDETGRSEIYVQSFPPGGGKWQITSNGGNFPRWRRDGKELFYMDSISFGKIVSVTVNVTGSKFESSAPRPLFDSGYINSLVSGHRGQWNTYAVSADGQRFLIPRPESNLTTTLTDTPITVVLNWTVARTAQEAAPNRVQ